MSPPPAQDAAAALKAQNRRSVSGSASPRAADAAKAPRSSPTPSRPAPNVHYSLIIRLPFPRGDFVDPPQVEWDASKDRKLWKIISKNSKSAEIDWAGHAHEFNVSQPFLLQQAAWLYERHFQHVKAQMNKLRTSNAPTPTAQPAASQAATSQASQQTAKPVGGYPMQRLGSAGSRAPSSMSIRPRDSPVARVDSAPPTRPTELSRTPSTATVTQSRPFVLPSSPRQPLRGSFGSRATTSTRRTEAQPAVTTDDPVASPPASSSTSDSSSSTDEETTAPLRQSQLFRRPPPYQRQKKPGLGTVDDGTEEETSDDSPTFLPFAGKAEAKQKEDISATLRDTERVAPTPPRTRPHPGVAAVAAQRIPAASTPRGKEKARIPLESSASSASSAAPTPSNPLASTTTQQQQQPQHQQQHQQQQQRPTALSPRHRAELARLSPRRSATAKSGSDGTPSMGSSFSDLDDTSITQSALEEALASNLRHGGASRLSSLGNAFGSRLYGGRQGQ